MGRDKSGDVEDNGDVSVERSRSDHGEENVIDLTTAACIHWVSTAAAAPLCSASSLPAAGRAWPSCGGEVGTARYPHLHRALSNLPSRTHI